MLYPLVGQKEKLNRITEFYYIWSGQGYIIINLRKMECFHFRRITRFNIFVNIDVEVCFSLQALHLWGVAVSLLGQFGGKYCSVKHCRGSKPIRTGQIYYKKQEEDLARP